MNGGRGADVVRGRCGSCRPRPWRTRPREGVPLAGTATYSFRRYYGFLFSFFFRYFELVELVAVGEGAATFSYRHLLVPVGHPRICGMASLVRQREGRLAGRTGPPTRSASFPLLHPIPSPHEANEMTTDERA